MQTEHKIYFQDSRDLSNIPDNSVQLIITSPPYWNRKDYDHENQIGYNQTYEDYVEDLNQVWSECYRVLHPGCKMCVNIGDLYTRTIEYGRHKIISIRTDVIKYCESIGFDFLGAIIWQKINRCHPTGGCNLMGSVYYPRNGIVKLDYEHILLFKKLGKAPKVSKEIKEKSKITLKEWITYFTGHWKIPGTKNIDHQATFPLEIPKRLIKMYSFVGETVLDPFIGSGTTTLASRILKRNSIGIEINKDFLPIIKEKIGYLQPGLFKDCNFKIFLEVK